MRAELYNSKPSAKDLSEGLARLYSSIVLFIYLFFNRNSVEGKWWQQRIVSTSAPLAGRADERWGANRRPSERETAQWPRDNEEGALVPLSMCECALEISTKVFITNPTRWFCPSTPPPPPTTIQATFPLLCRLRSQKTPHYMAPNLRLHRHRRRLRSVSWISWSLLAGSRVYFWSGSGRNKNEVNVKMRWITQVIPAPSAMNYACNYAF